MSDRDPFADEPSLTGPPPSPPAPSSGEEPARRRSRVGALLVGGGVAVVLIGLAAAALVLPRLPGDPVEAPPPPQVSRTATPSPTPTDFTAFLVDHRFNDEELGEWSCEVSVQAPRGHQELDSWVGSIVDCLDERFSAPIERAGHEAATPRRRFFSGAVTTDCGESKAAAFYCSADETIYLDTDEIGDYVDTMRLGAFHVIFHEYVHHVQQRLGIMRASNDFGPDHGNRRATVRRLELQADCVYVSSLRRLRQVEWTVTDTTELSQWRSTAGDDTHGTPTSQQHWLDSGIGSSSLSACNTWNAKSEDVA